MTRHHDAALTRYLLGELTETERTALEDDYFADGRLMERLEAAETELIDDYARGKLSGDQRVAFEARYLASADQVARVETARRLTAVQPATKHRPPWSWFVPVTALAASAALAAGAYFMTRPAEPEVIPPAISASAEQATPPVTSPPAPPPLIFALRATTRSQDASTSLAIPAGVEQVELRAPVVVPATPSKYRASLTTPEGREVYVTEDVSVVSSAPGMLRIIVPAPVLAPGDYIVSISASRAVGHEVLSEYSFRVVKR